MSQLRKLIFDALALVSLLFCGVTVLLWAWSYYRAESVYYATPWHKYCVLASMEELFLGDSLNFYVAAANERGLHYRVQESVDLPSQIGWTRHWGAAGFFVLAQDRIGQSFPAVRGVFLPLWFVTTASTLLPLKWQLERLKTKRKPAGMCATCGYDLRATPDRCPECGSVSEKVNA